MKAVRTLVLTLALAGAAVPQVTAAQGAALLYGAGEIRQAGISQFPKWTQMLSRFAGEQARMYQPCSPGQSCRLQQWARFLEGLRGYDRLSQIREVNRRMNLARYVPDRSNYGVGDYWATPGEFFDAAGDCEDYAIAKFLSLRLLGFADDQMRILVVRDTQIDQIHTVLVVAYDGQAYVLDNQASDILPASAVTRYQPYYGINEQAWWLYPPRGTEVASARVPSLQPGG